MHFWWGVLLSIVVFSGALAFSTETCLQCHQTMQGFSPFHQPWQIGCSGCHLGNPDETDKLRAHDGMVRVPGNVSVMEKTCGMPACHPTLAQHLNRNIMTTARGIVAVNRWVFGEATTPDGPGHMSRLDTVGADLHLRQLCATCHLAFPKNRPAPVTERSRGGGCVACHISYSAEAKNELQAYQAGGDLPKIHPRLTVRVEDRHCFGCHSRSGRISTNYQGWHETLLKELPEGSHPRYRKLEDGRIFEKKPADIHFEKGLQCIDCHTWQETMGNGKIVVHEEDQQVIQCEDCHQVQSPALATQKDFNIIDWKLLTLRDISLRELQPLVTHKQRQVLINAGKLQGSDSLILIQKNTGKRYPLKSPPESCTRNIGGHEHLSCQSCHTAWAPRCIACHVGFKPDVPGKDHLTGKQTAGRWVEYRALFEAAFPTLGMIENGNEYRIEPFIPGMILTIDAHQEKGEQPVVDFDRFLRLYAPVSPHTIQARGVVCQTCHANPVALGYGEGMLTLVRKEPDGWQWHFEPAYSPHPADGLPIDAWIPFLSDQPGMATRSNARSLPLGIQQRMLRVGACLTCHPYQPENRAFYDRFSQSLQRIKDVCRNPQF